MIAADDLFDLPLCAGAVIDEHVSPSRNCPIGGSCLSICAAAGVAKPAVTTITPQKIVALMDMTSRGYVR